MSKSKNGFLVLIIITAFISSCMKETMPLCLENAITLAPATQLITKAPIAGTAFPADRTIVLSAYFNGIQNPSGNYFQGVTFSKSGTTWSAEGKFWPSEGTLNLLGYSADGLNVAAAYNTNVSSGVTLTVPDNSSAQTDILWGYAASQSSGNAVNMQMYHAEAALAFAAESATAYDAVNNLGVTITDITVNNVKNSGTVKLNSNLTCTWSSLGAQKNLTLPGLSSGYNVPAAAMNLSSVPFGIGSTGLVVIPQTATTVTVTYTAHNGRDSGGNAINVTGQTADVALTGNWEAGKKYVYAIEFASNVSISASIFEWTDEGEDIPVARTASATYDVNGKKHVYLPVAKIAANSVIGIDWGDGSTEFISASTSKVKTLEHEYETAFDGNININVLSGSINFGNVVESEHEKFDIEDTGKVILGASVNALEFSSDKPNKLEIRDYENSHSFRYSYDGTNWEEQTISNDYLYIEFGTEEHPKVFLQGYNPDGLNPCCINAKNKFQCKGNINVLIDYSRNITQLPQYCYSSMFSYCSSLTEAPELPATTLARSCYNSMFNGCTSLTEAPELPATTLAANCYSSMFNGCTSLTEAPELPATTLADYCYSNMFSSCTYLTEAPELPATTLENSCYSNMFSSCTYLTEAPELPATTLADYCYYNMFYGCSSLTEAPELPATTLAESCYSYMFSGCSSLNYIKCLVTEINTEYFYSWVYYVSPTGTFVKAKGEEWEFGDSGIPVGWTVVEESSSLLPEGYTRVEYIASTSGNVYFNTGIKIDTDDLRIHAILTPTALNSTTYSYCAGGAAGSGNTRSMSIQMGTSRGAYAGLGDGDKQLSPSYSLTANTEYEIDWHATGGSFTGTINGTEVTASYGGTVASNQNYYILAENGNGSPRNYGRYRISLFEIYVGGTLKGRFIPCYNSSSTIGLYDTVTEKFFTKSGTGTLTKGNDEN